MLKHFIGDGVCKKRVRIYGIMEPVEKILTVETNQLYQFLVPREPIISSPMKQHKNCKRPTVSSHNEKHKT